MLVLSRKRNESIVIGKDVTLTVVEIRGDRVRLGVVAPRQVPIDRQEVHDRKRLTKYPTQGDDAEPKGGRDALKT